MQRIFSTRIDEATLDQLNRAVSRLGISKRQFLEDAIRLRVRQLERQGDADIWSETRGAWQRKERPGTTVRKARAAFHRTFQRHHRRA